MGEVVRNVVVTARGRETSQLRMMEKGLLLITLQRSRSTEVTKVFVNAKVKATRKFNERHV